MEKDGGFIMRHYENIYDIIGKLENYELLTEEECDDLLSILKPALGEFIPTREEYLEYKNNIELIKEYQKSIRTTDLIPDLLEKCQTYNEKYHKGE